MRSKKALILILTFAFFLHGEPFSVSCFAGETKLSNALVVKLPNPSAIIVLGSFSQVLSTIRKYLNAESLEAKINVENPDQCRTEFLYQDNRRVVALGKFDKQTLIFDPSRELAAKLRFIQELSILVDGRVIAGIYDTEDAHLEIIVFDKGTLIRHFRCINGDIIANVENSFGEAKEPRAVVSSDASTRKQYKKEWRKLVPETVAKSFEVYRFLTEDRSSTSYRNVLRGHSFSTFEYVNYQRQEAAELMQKQQYNSALKICHSALDTAKILQSEVPNESKYSLMVRELEKQLKDCDRCLEELNPPPSLRSVCRA